MKLVLQIFLKRKWSLGIIRIRHKNRFRWDTILLNILILRYKVRHYTALISRNIRVIFGVRTIFERLIQVSWPLISQIFSLGLTWSHHLHNVVFVYGNRSHNYGLDRWSLVDGKGNLLLSRSFEYLLLFDVIAVNIAIWSPIVWVRCNGLGNVMIIVIMRRIDLLVVDLLKVVSRKLTWCINLLVVLVHVERFSLMALDDIGWKFLLMNNLMLIRSVGRLQSVPLVDLEILNLLRLKVGKLRNVIELWFLRN